MPTRLWDKDQLTVTAEVTQGGDLTITGQDLSFRDGYEYVITIRRTQIPRLVAALGGSPGADPLPLLGQHAGNLIAKGERAWLQDHDIPLEFWAH